MPRKFRFSMLLLALLAGTAIGAKSLFWEPYEFDGLAGAIYHLDEAHGRKPVAVDLSRPTAPGDLDVGLGAPQEQKALSAREAANAIRTGLPAKLIGGAEFVKDGRFDGGVRLDGADGAIVLPRGETRHGFTLEFWFHADKLPDEGRQATLIAFAVRPPMTLTLDANGVLSLQWLDRRAAVPNWRCTAGKWTHVALIWEPLTDHLGGLRVAVNGRRRLVTDRMSIAGLGRTLGARRVLIGNGPLRKSGLKGRVDEIRWSTGPRQFYVPDLDWTDVKGVRPSPAGRPFFRDDGNLMLQLGFDEQLEPLRAPEGIEFPTAEIAKYRETMALAPNPALRARFFRDGVRREALVLGEKALKVRYEHSDLLLPQRGTIALWFRPVNWDNYKLWNRFCGWNMQFIRLFQFDQGEPDRPVMRLELVKTPANDAPNRLDVNPGRWVHLVVCWEGKRTWWYVDGAPNTHSGSWRWRKSAWKANRPLRLAFGDRGESLTVVDDFRIYRRALSQTEVANLAALYDRRKELQRLPDLEVRLDFNGVVGHTDVALFPLMENYAAAKSARVSLHDKGSGKALATAKTVLDQFALSRVRIESDPLEFRAYEVRCEALDAGGNAMGRTSASFQREEPPWWRNTIGVSDEPMPGWEPVRVDGNQVRIVDRCITLSSAALPTSVVSRGGDVLAAPLEVEARIGGRKAPLTGEGLKVLSRTPARVQFHGTGKLGELSTRIDCAVEFDGMMWVKLTFSSREPVEIDALRVRIPYTPNSARLMHWWSGNHNFRNPRSVWIGAVPAEQGTVFRSNDKSKLRLLPNQRGTFIPYMMLTGDARGMAWFAENDRHWTKSTETPAVSLVRSADAVTLVLNVISARRRIGEPLTLEFGLHPIPVKPLHENWRMTDNWTVIPDSFAGSNLKGDKSTQFWRHPADMDWDAVVPRYEGSIMQARWKEAPGRFRKRYGRAPKPYEISVPGLYQDLRRINAVPAHTREWYPVWRGLAHGAYDTLRYDRDHIDYSVWIWNEWLKHGIVRGVYMDDCWNSEQRVFAGPVCYKLPDGHVQPGFQWRGHREYLKRMRQCFHDQGLIPHMCAHTTHTYFVPYHAFFDIILDGEDDYKFAPNPKTFIDSWSPARLRFMHPAKWGQITTWLDWTGGSKAGEDAGNFPEWHFHQERAYMAAMLAHDLIWTDRDYKLWSRTRLDWSKIGPLRIRQDPGTVFIPYWNDGGLAKHEHETLLVSGWRRASLCLVVIANIGKERVQAKLALSSNAMGLAHRTLEARDVDTALLTYFDKENLKVRHDNPEVATKADPLDGFTQDQAETEIADMMGRLDKKPTLKERRAGDPDGAFEWKDGVLRCPVRPHDYRLFLFTPRPE